MTPPTNETERQLVDALHNVSLPVASNWWLVLREDGSYITDLGDREVEYGVVMEELSSFAASLDGLTAVAGRELFGHYATRANILADEDGMLVCHYLTQEIVWVLSFETVVSLDALLAALALPDLSEFATQWNEQR
jgi:hypothetical protein